MNESQRAVQSAVSEPGVPVGAPSSQGLTEQNEDDRELRRRRAAWQLRREQILFFYILVALPAFCVWAVTAEQAPYLKTTVGVFLAVSGAELVRFLTGGPPRLVTLLGTLVRVLTSHTRAGPH
jgi:hypothetical protein